MCSLNGHTCLIAAKSAQEEAFVCVCFLFFLLLPSSSSFFVFFPLSSSSFFLSLFPCFSLSCSSLFSPASGVLSMTFLVLGYGAHLSNVLGELCHWPPSLTLCVRVLHPMVEVCCSKRDLQARDNYTSWTQTRMALQTGSA